MSQQGAGGKKYGLYVPAKKGLSKPTGSVLFADDNDDDEVNEWQSTPVLDVKKREAQKVQREALEEDPNIYLYDEVLGDEPTTKKLKQTVKETDTQAAAKPKYMNALLAKAVERKSLLEITRVRLMKKEAALDAHLHADKDVIVTAAYQKKLEAMKERMEAEEVKDKAEEAEGKKTSGMTGFYKNLLDQDFGGKARRAGATSGAVRSESSARRYGKNATEPEKPEDKETVEGDEEEEVFGPVRRK